MLKFIKRWNLLLIISIIILLDINFAKADGFVFGPKLDFTGNDTSNLDSIYYKNNQAEVFSNSVLRALGKSYRFGLFGGWLKKISFVELGLIFEINYYYSYKLLSEKNRKPGNFGWQYRHVRDISTMGINAFYIPILFKISIPALKIYLGPRMRFLFYINEKENTTFVYINNTKKYKTNYFDLYSRFMLGINKWGVEIGCGLEIFRAVGTKKDQEKILFDLGVWEYSWILSVSYDVLSFL